MNKTELMNDVKITGKDGKNVDFKELPEHIQDLMSDVVTKIKKKQTNI